MALSLHQAAMLDAVREVRAELEAVRSARRRLPTHDYLSRALLAVEQQKLESRLAEVRRASRGM